GEQLHAHGSRSQAARRALEDAATELRLDLANVLANRADCHAELLGGLGEAAESSRHLERAQGRQRVAIEPVHRDKLNRFATILHPQRASGGAQYVVISREVKTMRFYFLSRLVGALKRDFQSAAAAPTRESDPIDHPAIAAMSLRELADLPLRPDPIP